MQTERELLEAGEGTARSAFLATAGEARADAPAACAAAGGWEPGEPWESGQGRVFAGHCGGPTTKVVFNRHAGSHENAQLVGEDLKTAPHSCW